jgi:hypothetical protein
MCGQRPFAIVFYETSQGDKPVLRWIKEDLSVRQRRALGYAIYRLLQRYGVSVCDTEFGRQLGGGLFEFRLRVKARRDGERRSSECSATPPATGSRDQGRAPPPDRASEAAPRR